MNYNRANDRLVAIETLARSLSLLQNSTSSFREELIQIISLEAEKIKHGQTKDIDNPNPDSEKN
ncbi:hypothetical protein [Sphingobacterium multivorum]|uniref:hypothetical protein n=1 Tax=Sphingobacterium multivorum TaxID=28454 RepID=UPI00301AAAC4